MKWNQMTALRFQTGVRHQASPVFLRGLNGKEELIVVIGFKRPVNLPGLTRAKEEDLEEVLCCNRFFFAFFLFRGGGRRRWHHTCFFSDTWRYSLLTGQC